MLTNENLVDLYKEMNENIKIKIEKEESPMEIEAISTAMEEEKTETINNQSLYKEDSSYYQQLKINIKSTVLF